MHWSMVELLLNEPWNSKLISLKPRLYHGVIYVIATNDKLLIVIEKYVKYQLNISGQYIHTYSQSSSVRFNSSYKDWMTLFMTSFQH